MGTDLTILEREIAPLAPHFEQALAGVMPVDRLIRTALISVERNPDLLTCNRQTFFNSIMTAGVLGLEMDGVTGQAFPIPFAKKVQLVIGYKGYNTLGARAGLTISGEVVREGDEFEYSLGTDAFVKHKPSLGTGRRIIAAWALAAAHDRPPVISILGIDELLEIKAKSPGARKSDSPWNNPSIGFPAMCSKSAKRRLCRSTPLNVRMQLAARMEEAYEEQGLHSFIAADQRLVIEEFSPIAERQRNATPSAEQLTAPLNKDDGLQYIRDDGAVAAGEGLHSLRIWFGDLPRPLQAQMKEHLDGVLKSLALKIDIAASKNLDTAPLEAINTRIREVIGKDEKLLGEWNAAYLERKRELSKLKTAAE